VGPGRSGTLTCVSDESALVGGMDPSAGVVRVGDTVRRPARRSSPATRALLLHLEAVGFEGAPRFLGVDEAGRDVLTFVEGDVPLPPYPAWALTDEALESLGRLLRRYHDATATFDQRSATGWSDEWSDPEGGPVVCHNDLFPENVVLRDGRVVAFIDFAEAAPGRPLWDLAVACQEWAPLHAPGARLHHPDRLDGVRRAGLLARAYGLGPERAAELVDVIGQERARELTHVRAQAASGREPWASHWAETDGEGRAAADDGWLRENRAALVRAVSEQ
jgi:Ser/Thr protein kinase RdoA (MazF antagonist)